MNNEAKYNHNNIFAQIIHKDIVTNIIYENEYVIAFNDINPVAPIHVLVLPKQPYICFSDFVKKEGNVDNFFRAVAQVADLIGAKDYRIIANNGPLAGQTVFHFHVHIISGKEIRGLIP